MLLFTDEETEDQRQVVIWLRPLLVTAKTEILMKEIYVFYML